MWLNLARRCGKLRTMTRAHATSDSARERSGADRSRRHGSGTLTRVETDHQAVTQLQRTAGNRAVVDLMGTPAVQRHMAPTMPAEVEAAPGTGTGSGGADYTALAKQIQKAIEGVGTDEDAVYRALEQCGRDPAKVTALAAAYKAVTGRELEADIRDDFSGSELQRALKLMSGPNRQEQIEAVMRTTAAGIWALKVIADHSVDVDWEYTGQGSFHRGGKIFLNKTLSIDGAAIVMMHEAQHAQTFKTGKAADVAALTREAFVKAKIADEAEAVVRQIEGAEPMQKAGKSLAGSGITAALITKYNTEYAKAAKALREGDPELAEADVHAKARTQTRDGEVTNWFHDGTFVTSTGNITYSDHYGNYWDSQHKPPTPAPAESGVAPAGVAA
jgi:hypothetical protein